MMATEDLPWETQAEAQEYNELCQEIVRDPNPDYLRILDQVTLSDSCKLLDLGCGTGNITYKLAERVGSKSQVIGVDPDKERIAIAQQNNKQSNLSFLVGDGESFPKDKYDVVFCNYAMGSIENKKAVFEQVAQNLRPGGQFIIVAILGLPPIAFELSRLMGVEREQVINEMWFHLPATVYDDLAAACGFRVRLREEEIARYKYPTVDSLMSSWFAVTHGRFDPAVVDQTALEEFKRKYDNQEIEWKLPIARFILTKL